MSHTRLLAMPSGAAIAIDRAFDASILPNLRRRNATAFAHLDDAARDAALVEPQGLRDPFTALAALVATPDLGEYLVR